MNPFRTLTSTIAPLPIKDIDTDMIIPAQFLTSVSNAGFGPFVFKRLRDEDSDFVLNQPRFQKAKILVTRSNFGCGSSREHAVWALAGWGFRVIIAPSFADIFSSNSAKNGLVLVELADEYITKILSIVTESPESNFSIDLEAQIFRFPDNTEVSFPFDPFAKECILKGYDDLAYILENESDIDAYFSKRDEVTFYSTKK